MSNVCEGSWGCATESGGGRNSLEIVDSFCYLGNVILCGGGIESAVRIGVSGGRRGGELASLLVFTIAFH